MFRFFNLKEIAILVTIRTLKDSRSIAKAMNALSIWL